MSLNGTSEAVQIFGKEQFLRSILKGQRPFKRKSILKEQVAEEAINKKFNKIKILVIRLLVCTSLFWVIVTCLLYFISVPASSGVMT